jgi:hypothetical protein
MDDHDDDDDALMARLDELLNRPIEESLAWLELKELGRTLAWAVTRPARVLEEYGLPLDDDARLELIAWTLELARRCESPD